MSQHAIAWDRNNGNGRHLAISLYTT